MNTSKSRTILVVGSRSNEQLSQESLARVSDYVSDLVTDDNVTCYATFMDDIVYTISEDSFEAFDTRNNLSLKDVDCIMPRGHGIGIYTADSYNLSVFCEQNNIPIVLSYANYYPATKVAQAAIFRELHVPFIETLYIANSQKLIQHAAEHFGYPYILKGSRGERGESNYLIHDLKEAESALLAEPTTDFLAQRFCPNDRDYRVLILGDEQLIFERRGSGETHLNNTSQGGSAALAHDHLPDEIIAQARAIMKRLKLRLAGVDVIPNTDTGKFYFLEINTQPQVQTGSLHEEKKEVMRKFLLALTNSKKLA